MARHWRTTIAIRIPSGRRANSSSSVTGLPLIIEKKIILIRVSIKKRKLSAASIDKFRECIPAALCAHRDNEEGLPVKNRTF